MIGWSFDTREQPSGRQSDRKLSRAHWTSRMQQPSSFLAIIDLLVYCADLTVTANLTQTDFFF